MKKKAVAMLKKWASFEVADKDQMKRGAGNMNEDAFDDFSDLNTRMKDYLMIEVVAVPHDFEITNHLKMREAAGIFEHEKVNLKQLAIISEGVKASPIFSVLNNPVIEPETCMYFLHIMSELGLVIKSIDNPIKRNRQDYDAFLKGWDSQKYNYVRGQDIMKLNFIVINLVPIYQQHVMDEAVEAVNQVLKHTADVKKMKERI